MFDKFSERHIGVSNEKDLKAMLEVIGAKSVDELISQVIPQSIRLKKPLALPAEGMSEYEFAAHIRSLADRNRCLRSFIGMGYYPCAVPAAVSAAPATVESVIAAPSAAISTELNASPVPAAVAPSAAASTDVEQALASELDAPQP